MTNSRTQKLASTSIAVKNLLHMEPTIQARSLSSSNTIGVIGIVVAFVISSLGVYFAYATWKVYQEGRRRGNICISPTSNSQEIADLLILNGVSEGRG